MSSKSGVYILHLIWTQISMEAKLSMVKVKCSPTKKIKLYLMEKICYLTCFKINIQ